MLIRRSENGDTIIEVLFAITVFSLIAIGGLSLMNQGTAMAQRALEIGLVRQQVDAQADALRYLNKAYVADYGKHGAASQQWDKIVTDHAVDQAQRFDTVADSTGCHLPAPADHPFTLDLTKLTTNPVLAPTTDVTTYARVRYDTGTARAEGIWIQAVRSATKIGGSDGRVRPGFYDFHIRACWSTPGQAVPVTVGTIVRLYEPRG
jgi:type II secretory pathway pseudopilin PulG